MNTLVVFTLAIDEEDPYLAFVVDWIKELRARHSGRLIVIATNVGLHDRIGGVEIIALRRSRREPRIFAGIRFINVCLRLLFKESIKACFYHMSPQYYVLSSPFLFNVSKRYLWYAHNKKNIWLKCIQFMSPRIITSHPTAYPGSIHRDRFHVIGQFISCSFINIRTDFRGKVVLGSIGRISPVKRIDLMISTVSYLVQSNFGGVSLCLYGGTVTEADVKYKDELKQHWGYTGLSEVVSFKGPFNYRDRSEILSQIDVFLSCCQSGMDKAPLEAMAAGLPTFFMNCRYASFLSADLTRHFYCDPLGGYQLMSARILDFIALPVETRAALTRRLSDEIRGTFDRHQFFDRIYEILN